MTKTEKIERKREKARLRQQRHRERQAAASGSGKAPDLSGQLTSAAAQGPLSSAMSDFIFRKVDGNFYEVLREGIPIFDSAIRRLITFNGTIRIIGDRPALVRELEDFCLNVPVNDMQKGIHAFAENSANETFEQGFSISEFVANKKRDDIERLVVADSKQLFFRKNKKTSAVEPWHRAGRPQQTRYTMPGDIAERLLNAAYGQTVSHNGVDETRLNPDNKIYFSINNENQDPHGVSLFRSTEFVAQILITIQNSMKHVAERFGDPSFHVHLAAAASDKNLDTRKTAMTTDFNTIITAKRQGKSGDFFTAAGPNSTVVVKAIGHEGQVISFDIQLRHLLEQIVSKTGLAAWLLGIYWSTTERMATLEIESALADAKIRQYAMLPEYIRLFSNFLRLRGRTWNSVTTSLDKPGDWGMIFESPNMRDVLAMANARFLNAQADMMERGQFGGASSTSVQVGQATFALGSAKDTGATGPLTPKTCGCGKSHSEHRTLNSELTKELTRAAPWPELDRIEHQYEQTLKEDWALLQEKVFDILGLKPPLPSGGEGRGEGAASKAAHKAFAFDDSQREAIFRALKEFLGWYDPADADSSIRWYYAQSYSLGLIQAAHLVGKDRPLLDILQNQGIYSDLVTNGFQLVRDNATRVIRNEIIDQMELGMTQGAGPRDVARHLEAIFGDQNSDWERLARTEMSAAAERAKLDEWKERDVDVSNAVIVPIHPRCRCSTTVRDDGDGNFRAVFAPAPDACPWCMSYLTGDKTQKTDPSGQSDMSYLSDMSDTLKKIAERPINIKIEQAPMQLALTLDKTPMNYEMEKDPKTGKIRMKQIAQEAKNGA